MREILMPLHIASGTVSLLLGTYLLFRRKGDKLHRKLGLMFYYGMLVVAFSSFGLAYINPNFFLGTMGAFALYLNVTGRRYLIASRSGSTGQITDWLVSVFMMGFGLTLLYLGLTLVTNSNSFGVVSVVFGILSLFMVAADYKRYRTKGIRNPEAIGMHLQRMCAAYIASLTAFVVVNFPAERIGPSLGFIPWLAPSLLVVPFIVKWSRKYRKMMKPSTGQS